MPTSPETLARQVSPLRTGAAAVEVEVRQFNRWPHVETPTATGPISDAELTAIHESARWSAAFNPVPTTCNGNCAQGRYCDCVPDQDCFDKPPMTRRDGWTVVVLAICCAAVWYFAIWGMV